MNNPEESRIPPIYFPPTGGPFYWRNIESDELRRAIMRLAESWGGGDDAPDLTEDEVAWIADYFRYWINAPCWMDSSGKLEILRENVLKLKTQEDLEVWLEFALDLSIDPL